MFNDATALVAYKVAIVAAVTGDITGGDIALELVEAVGFGVAVGFALGYLSRIVLARIHDGYAETTVTVLVPFVAYVGAEHVNGSGVLAVLVLGLYLRTFAHDATTSGGWLLGRAVWSYADFLITSLVFALLGFELVAVIRSTGTGTGTMRLAMLVVGTLVVFRAVWIYPGRLARSAPGPPPRRPRPHRLARVDRRRVGGHAGCRHCRHGRRPPHRPRDRRAPAQPRRGRHRRPRGRARDARRAGADPDAVDEVPRVSAATSTRPQRSRTCGCGPPRRPWRRSGTRPPTSTRTCAAAASRSTRATSPPSRRSPGPVRRDEESGRRACEPSSPCSGGPATSSGSSC